MKIKFDFWKSKSCAQQYTKLFNDNKIISSPYYKALIKTILREVKIRTTEKNNILDAGCGEGYLCREIKKLHRRISGCDISEDMINLAKKKDPSSVYWIQNLEKPRSGLGYEKYDLIICNLVLIDLINIKQAINNMYDYLKRNGTLIISIPHPCYFHKINQDWFINESDKKLEIENYFDEGIFPKKIAGHIETYHFHRTIETYTKLFKLNNLFIERLLEPKPKIINNISLKKASLIPFYLIFILRKI